LLKTQHEKYAKKKIKNKKRPLVQSFLPPATMWQQTFWGSKKETTFLLKTKAPII